MVFICCNGDAKDSSDPTAGVAIYYYGGDYYYEGWYYYSVWIYFRCSDTPEIATEADVDRYGLASFNIWLDSVYACPTGISGCSSRP